MVSPFLDLVVRHKPSLFGGKLLGKKDGVRLLGRTTCSTCQRFWASQVLEVTNKRLKGANSMQIQLDYSVVKSFPRELRLRLVFRGEYHTIARQALQRTTELFSDHSKALRLRQDWEPQR